MVIHNMVEFKNQINEKGNGIISRGREKFYHLLSYTQSIIKYKTRGGRCYDSLSNAILRDIFYGNGVCFSLTNKHARLFSTTPIEEYMSGFKDEEIGIPFEHWIVVTSLVNFGLFVFLNDFF